MIILWSIFNGKNTDEPSVQSDAKWNKYDPGLTIAEWKGHILPAQSDLDIL